MVGSVYNYYLTAYGNKELNKSEVHKKSELRSIYNAIVTVNKKSPLYKVNKSEDLQKYVINLKENAISLSGAARAFEKIPAENPTFNKKAISSNENVVTARYIGNPEDESGKLEISVNKLATPQINEGTYLNPGRIPLSPGKYSFDVQVDDVYYEFHTNVKAQDSPKDLQERIARLVTNSKIGIMAGIKNSIDGSSSLILQSSQTGVKNYNSQPFLISENESNSQKGLVDYLGLNNMVTKAENSQFAVNGVPRSSSSNNINLAETYEITLQETTSLGEVVELSAQDDYDAFMEDVRILADNYNQVLKLSSYKSESTNKSTSLYDELKDIGKKHKNELDSIGLRVNDDGSFTVEESLFANTIREGTLSETIKAIHSFKDDIVSKSNTISLNPMQYVNKTMISYPHPIRPITNPYTSSIYSGMMYNNYV